MRIGVHTSRAGALENAALQEKLSEAHTGYRAYSRGFLETVPWRRNSDGFVFDTQMIFQAFAFQQRLVEVPIRTVYEADSSNISLAHSLEYGLRTLGVSFRYATWRRLGGHSRLFRPEGEGLRVNQRWPSKLWGSQKDPRSRAI